MHIPWVVAKFEMIPHVLVAPVWRHILHVRFETTTQHIIPIVNYSGRNSKIKIQLYLSQCFFYLNYQSPTSFYCEYFNRQVHFLCTTKLNNIPETNQTKTFFCLSKLRGTSQKLICLTFHAPVTKKAHSGAPAGLRGQVYHSKYNDSHITPI